MVSSRSTGSATSVANVAPTLDTALPRTGPAPLPLASTETGTDAVSDRSGCSPRC